MNTIYRSPGSCGTCRFYDTWYEEMVDCTHPDELEIDCLPMTNCKLWVCADISVCEKHGEYWAGHGCPGCENEMEA